MSKGFFGSHRSLNLGLPKAANMVVIEAEEEGMVDEEEVLSLVTTAASKGI